MEYTSQQKRDSMPTDEQMEAVGKASIKVINAIQELGSAYHNAKTPEDHPVFSNLAMAALQITSDAVIIAALREMYKEALDKEEVSELEKLVSLGDVPPLAN